MLLLTILTTTVCCYAQPSRPFLGNERVAKKPHTRRPGGTTMNKNTSGDAIVANERRVWEALKKRDISSLDALLADDLSVVNENGTMTKPAFLQSVPNLTITYYSIEDAKVTFLSSEVAVLTYKATFLVLEPDYPSNPVYQTTVWVKRGGKWLAALNQETATK